MRKQLYQMTGQYLISFNISIFQFFSPDGVSVYSVQHLQRSVFEYDVNRESSLHVGAMTEKPCKKYLVSTTCTGI